MVEFIEEWFIEQTLGEGGFGDVKLLVNRRTQAEVALKTIDVKEANDSLGAVKKEVEIHKMLVHENIIRFYGSRQEGSITYMFLEYASGGELFDRIEPDVGMDSLLAQSYFLQLLKGVEYLHKTGIAHRDIKPENILLDSKNVLKISDFGFATVFRTRGVERLLEKRCGTLPYVAPEVLVKPYKAVPSDIWSCGVVLVALLVGELPWDRPCLDCPEYKNWKDDQKITQHNIPWSKLELSALNFVKRVLCPQPSKRLSIEQMLAHPWMTKRPTGCSGIRRRSGSPLDKEIEALFSYSQPVPRLFGDDSDTQGFDEHDNNPPPAKRRSESPNEKLKAQIFSFSQPAAPAEDFFIGSQLTNNSPTKKGNNNNLPIHRLVKRMTRFCVSTTAEKTMKELTNALECLGCTFKTQKKPFPMVTVTMMDRRKTKLVFKANVIEMGANNLVLLDFRLSSGDGLEFKRQFIRVREQLKAIEMTGPVSWPFALATNSVPS